MGDIQDQIQAAVLAGDEVAFDRLSQQKREIDQRTAFAKTRDIKARLNDLEHQQVEAKENERELQAKLNDLRAVYEEQARLLQEIEMRWNETNALLQMSRLNRQTRKEQIRELEANLKGHLSNIPWVN